MKKRLLQVSLALAAILAIAQFVRPDLSGPPIDQRRTIQAQVGTSPALAAVLRRSCGDCHSSETVRPAWFTRVAPVSWVMAYAVREGRKAVNFSEWAAYPPDRQKSLLGLSWSAVSAGRMSGTYTTFRAETKLSTGDIETICAAAQPQRR